MPCPPSFLPNSRIPALRTRTPALVSLLLRLYLIVEILCNFSGVKNVEVDLSNQVVRVLGSSPVKTMSEALEQTGRKSRLIGQGVPEG